MAQTALQDDGWVVLKKTPRYSINIDGVIKINATGKIRKSYLNRGYLITFLVEGETRKGYTVHRLIAEYFIPNPENKPYINHKNGIKHDNRIENLEWCTHSENCQHAYDAGLNKGGRENCRKVGLANWSKAVNARKRPVIDTRTGILYESSYEASKQTKYSRTYFSQMLNGSRNNNTTFLYAT